MTFKIFADYLSILEKTTLRNEITKILSVLFRESEDKEIDKICYLLLGRLAPKFETIEFQFAKKMMIRAIAQTVNFKLAEVEREFKKKGDLGDVISNYKLNFWRSQIPLRGTKSKIPTFAKASAGRQNSKYTVNAVYGQLLNIAREEGEGSVERKVNGMAELLQNLDPISAKYVVRMVLGLLRLGFSDMTILDALSWMETGDKSLRLDIEEAYNNSTDIGLIAKTFKKGKISAIKKISAQPGVPIRPQQSERLPKAEEIIKKLGECAVEYKLDGLRAQVHIISNIKYQISNIKKKQKQLLLSEKRDDKEIRIFSRNLENTTHMFPEIVEAARALPVDSAIFDGEAIGIDPKNGTFLPFQDTAQRKRKHNITATAKKVPVKYFAFDILYLNGEDLLNKSFRERRKVLEKILS